MFERSFTRHRKHVEFHEVPGKIKIKRFPVATVTEFYGLYHTVTQNSTLLTDRTIKGMH